MQWMFVGERKRQTAAAYIQQDTVLFMQSVDGLHVTWHFTHGHITQTRMHTNIHIQQLLMTLLFYWS